MQITISDNLRLELINESHSQPIFELVDQNRDYLKQWLSLIDTMKTVVFAEKFVQETMERNSAGLEYAFVIIDQQQVIGRIGIYKINQHNKIGEIGYWIAESAQGKGTITKSCTAMIDFCFTHLALNRIELKCGTENIKSNAIAKKLNFAEEGVIRQGEFLYNKFIDLNLYALLKEVYHID